MGYQSTELTCANLTWNLKQAAKQKNLKGATLRVDDIFRKCPQVGEWGSRPATLTSCLVFITKTSAVNVTKKPMNSIPQKHIGIFYNNKVWHYSNSRNKVANQSVKEFKNHYGSTPSAQKMYRLYYGKFPP